MPTEPRPVSLFDIVKRAVEICDPNDSDPRLGELLEQFEDDDEPVTAIENLEERLAIAVEGVDVEIEDPAVSMATATICISPIAATSSMPTRAGSSGSPRGMNGRATRRSRSWSGSPTAGSRFERRAVDHPGAPRKRGRDPARRRAAAERVRRAGGAGARRDRPEGVLEPPDAGEIVLAVPSPEALSRDPDEVRKVIERAGTGTEPLIVVVDSAEELREQEIAPVVEATSHSERPVILRIVRNA